MRLKRLSEILTRLIDITLVNTSEVNDFSTGSTILSIYEAFSMELEQYYMLSRENIVWGIEQGVLNGFNFYKREAKRAYGTVTIEFHTVTQDPIVLSRGTSFDSVMEGYQGTIAYETIQEYIIPSGTVTFKVDVYATRAGEIGNLPRGYINRMINGVGNVRRVYNEEDFLTGAKEESIDSVKRRFHAYVESRGRATVKALDYGTRQVEEISGVYIKESVGQVIVYAHDRNGNLSPKLVSDIEINIEDYRPAGIQLLVRPVKKKVIDMELTVVSSDKSKVNQALSGKIERTVSNYLNSQEASQELVLADIIQAVMNIDDIVIYDCTIENYDGNIQVASEEIIRAGDITVDLI